MAETSRFRMQLRRHAELLAQVRRGVNQKPVLCVGADGDRCLGALKSGLAPRRAAYRATAIPLWNAATGGGSQNEDAKHGSSPGCLNATGGGHLLCPPSPTGDAAAQGGPPPSKCESFAGRYLRAAQAYMLISMPTGTSTIFGVFQDIFGLLVRGTIFALGTQGNALQKLRQRF